MRFWVKNKKTLIIPLFSIFMRVGLVNSNVFPYFVIVTFSEKQWSRDIPGRENEKISLEI